MDLSFLTMFINTSKVGGWARAAVAAAIPVVLAKYPALTAFLPPDAQTALEVLASAVAVGAWSHVAKGLDPDYTIPGYNAKGQVVGVRPPAALVLFFILVGATFFACLPAFAAPMVAKDPPPAQGIQYCTPTSCTGFYLGAGIAGNGTNADIVGSGVDGSVFAGGGIPFADVGWMSWNGTTLLGFEVGGGAQINVGTAVNGVASNETGYDFYQEIQYGGNLAAIINNGSAPITPPTSLLQYMMAPYLAFGVDERPFGTGWRTGAGAKFAIGNNMFLDIGYRYINYGAATNGALTFNAENLVFVKFNRAF